MTFLDFLARGFALAAASGFPHPGMLAPSRFKKAPAFCSLKVSERARGLTISHPAEQCQSLGSEGDYCPMIAFQLSPK